ncbi:MAG: hypothetical protein NTZ93_02110 [Candidatus Beckwithbacteria bacterium]|nr:hypothetical protein [Candidatus Beckwithbacteria bacterium]
MKILGLDRGASFVDAVIIDNKKIVFNQSVSRSEFSSSWLDSLPSFDQKVVAQDKNELDCVCQGALFLASLTQAVVVSCGTGTSVSLAKTNQPSVHLGGTGIGGGTLIGLAKLILKTDQPEIVFKLAQTGDKTQVNLTVGDILNHGIGLLPPEATAANFGKLKSTKKEDIAAGIICLVSETIAMTSCLAAKSTQENNLVFVGRLATNKLIQNYLRQVCALFQLQPLFFPDAAYATALGAALSYQP